MTQIAGERFFGNVDQLLPHARIRTAEDVRQDIGDLFGRERAGQQLLGLAGVAEKVDAVGEVRAEFLDERLEDRRLHRAQLAPPTG